ncbi:MAG: MFS transporter [Thermoleophilia bacterium]
MSSPQTVPPTNKNVVLAVTTLGSFSTPLIMSSLNVALPTIGEEFDLSAVALGSLATVYLVVTAALLVPIGKMADTHGRKRVFLYGMAILSGACLFSAAAPSFPWLVASLLLQGAGAAMIFSTGPAILTAVFPPGERGRALGINVAAIYLGLSLGPAIGGILTGTLGWRSIFILPAALGTVVIAFVVIRVHDEWVVPRVARFDLAGTVIYAVALVALTAGFSTLPKLSGAALAIGGLTAGAVFVWWELRAADPILNIDLFRRNRVFAFSNVAALINYSATFAVGFLLSLYLQYVKGFTVETAGFILMAQPVMQTLFSPLAGRLSDKVESRVVASTGMALTTVGLLLLTFLGADAPVPFIALVLALLGFGFALFSAPNTNTVMSSVDDRFLGVASATLGTMRLLGQMLSMAIALLVFSVTLGSAQVTDAVHDEFVTAVRIAFGISTALCAIGVAASLARGRLRAPTEGSPVGAHTAD